MIKYKQYSLIKSFLILLVASLVQACSVNIPIDTPEVSKFSYTPKSDQATVQLSLKESFDENHQVSHGRLKINLIHDDTALNAKSFILSSLKQELESRKLPIVYNDLGQNTIDFKEFEVLNHRVSGFSPLVTISTIKAELITKDGTKNIAAMVKRGKVPVWKIDEVNEPCYNEPVELLIKETAAKINKNLFGYSLTDDQVSELVKKIKNESDNSKLSYLDVYELGFSNNATAIEPLKELVKHKGDYIRMAAISSLGILGVEDYVGDLISIYTNSKLWQDRGMALKAIGDIGTDEAIEFLKQEKTKWESLTSKEAKWNTLIIGMYL